MGGSGEGVCMVLVGFFCVRVCVLLCDCWVLVFSGLCEFWNSLKVFGIVLFWV